ncbi:MAG TPA: alkaline phosphatase family protein [Solirubrobacteraceae bacterium]|jgi:phospholipase C|nr:alkaline phosphatase family protein [Solirubrobacteraceae bacterium]
MRTRPHPLRALAVLAPVAVAMLAMASASASAAPRAPQGPVNATTPCVSRSAGQAHIKHVIVLFMENQPYVKVVGSPEAPYINGLAARCGLATNYHNITHPSAPEYLTATSGELGGAGDCPPVFLDPSWPATCPDANNNIFNQTTSVGESWKVYEESMATNCLEGEDETNYDINHNPAAYYTDLGGPSGAPHSPCKRFDVPLGTFEAGNLESALAHGQLANYSFIAPNLINDTHNSTVAVGDEYLSHMLPTIMNSHDYKNGSTALFVVWDEGEGGSTDECAYNTTDIGCHVAMVVISPYTTPGTQSAELFNHYSLLKTSEELLGLPLLGHANDAQVQSMIGAFNL